MRTTEVPPYAPTLMESTRAIGYSIEAAIADIIDNSITALASRIDIDFFPIGKAYISILDDGMGMDEPKLIEAMQYGSQSPLETRDINDLGRYGLGLKTASLSQCRVLTVISKFGEKTVGAQWNLNHIKNAGTWSLILLEDLEFANFPGFEKLKKYESGTLVVWQELDKFAVGESNIEEIFSEKMDLIRDHISLVFHRYLNGEALSKKLDIKMNEISIEPKDPFLYRKSTQLMDEETILVRGKKIKFKPYILPHTSRLTQKELKELGGKEGIRKSQGFYIYRNKRLLIWGTWFRLMRQGELTKLARVQVDIPNSLDDLWTLDIRKSTAIPPEEVRKNLAVVIEKISSGSKRTWTYRGKKEINDDIVHLWNRVTTRDGGVFYEINAEHPLISSLKDLYPGIGPKLEPILKQIGLSLPLNSLYVDLASDYKVENENETDSIEMVNLLKAVVSPFADIEKRFKLIDELLLTEPFCNYREDILRARERGDFND